MCHYIEYIACSLYGIFCSFTKWLVILIFYIWIRICNTNGVQHWQNIVNIDQRANHLRACCHKQQLFFVRFSFFFLPLFTDLKVAVFIAYKYMDRKSIGCQLPFRMWMMIEVQDAMCKDRNVIISNGIVKKANGMYEIKIELNLTNSISVLFCSSKIGNKVSVRHRNWEKKLR